jgi:CRP-like cAMP-binding protein
MQAAPEYENFDRSILATRSHSTCLNICCFLKRTTVSLHALAMRIPGQLPAPAQQALAGAVAQSKAYARGETLVEAGERPSQLHLISTGWAARSIALKDGSRQITDFLLAGDICDLSSLGPGLTDHVVALTPVTVMLIDRRALISAMEAHPRLAVAVMNLAFAEQSLLRAWIVCFGLRDRLRHIAHLLCELQERLRRVGLAGEESFEAPLTQRILADATGMSTVHINRTLHPLRQEGAIAWRRQRLEVLKPRRLREIAEYDPAYLRA